MTRGGHSPDLHGWTCNGLNSGQKKARRGRAFSVFFFEGLVARAPLAGLRLVDLQGTTLEVSTVQGFDSLAATFIIHLDEAETTGAAGLAIFDDICRSDLAILGKQGVQIGRGSGPGQIANIDILRQESNSKKKEINRMLFTLMKTAIIRMAKTVFNSRGIQTRNFAKPEPFTGTTGHSQHLFATYLKINFTPTLNRLYLIN
jgi:hypothetical protein